MARSQALRGVGSIPFEEGSNPHGPTILIIENDASYADQLVRALLDSSTAGGYIPRQVGTSSGVDIQSYIKDDLVDIYIVDLKLDDPNQLGRESKIIGINIVKELADKTNAGIIVHSSEPAETDAWPLILLGADEYIEKPESPTTLRRKVLSLWRRIQMIRPASALRSAHTHRAFMIGDWRFVVGKPEIVDERGSVVRLSPTEHAFLRYLCVVDDHQIDVERFNVEVLGRPSFERDKRIDGLVYKIRKKLGPSVQLNSQWHGSYRLDSVRELRSFTAS